MVELWSPKPSMGVRISPPVLKLKNMKTVKGIGSSLLSALGGVCVVAGELDDAPGLGGIGLILIGISIYLNLKKN